MRRRRLHACLRAGRLAVVAFLLAVTGVTPARAATSVVPTGVEAWYHTTPLPLEGIPATNPYGEETLHVGVRAGTETARTYLTLDLGSVPDGARITAAVLALPVLADAGTLLAAEATIDVCLAPDPGQSIQGSLEEPPEGDCFLNARARYEETRFTVDLGVFAAATGPFTGGLRSGGLVIMASPETAEDADTWHVAFPAKDNAEGPRITAEVTYELAPADPVPAPAPPVFVPDPGIGFGGGAPAVTSPLAIPDPRAPGPVALPDRPQPVEVTEVNFGVAPPDYLSWILLLPLLLVLFVGYFGSALVREDDGYSG